MNVLDGIARSSPSQRVLRGVEVAAPVLFLAAIPASGGAFHPGLSIISVLLAVLMALLPDSHTALGLVLYLGGLWAMSTRGLDLWTLVAVVLLLALHLACTLSSYGPPGLRLDAVLLAVWRRRTMLCVEAAVLVWAVAVVLDLLDLPASRVAVGAGLLVVLAWVALLTVRLAGPAAD